jgi:hypothetical protein
MAFGLEYTASCPFLRGTAERGQAMTLGVVLYAGLTRTSMTGHDSSCLGYIAYLSLILALLILKDDHSDRSQSLAHCQELLDSLNVGLVLQGEDDVMIANQQAFDLLKLKRGDVAGLKTKLAVQPNSQTPTKPSEWTNLETARGCAGSRADLQQSLPDGGLHVEYSSEVSSRREIGWVGEKSGTRVFGLRTTMDEKPKPKQRAESEDRSRLLVLTSFAPELKNSLNGTSKV